VRGIADLERGTRRFPYVDTLRRLSGSLGLTPFEREEFEAAGRRPARATQPTRLASPDKTVRSAGFEVMPLSAPVTQSLPAEFTSFVGREGLLAELAQLLNPGARRCRLATLTGPGGSGKTRVALRVAAALRDEFEDGVCFVALAPINDVQL